MANNQLITASGVLVTGTAQDNTQTDNIVNEGADNTIVGIGGNIDVTGQVSDTATTVILTQFMGGTISGVTDNFTLDGSNNVLVNENVIDSSAINFTVLGNGGSNLVELGGLTNSAVNVNIGVDPSANAPAGGNVVEVFNSGGTNNVGVGGPGNFIALNGDATNTVTATGGGGTVQIGSSDDDLFGWSSTVTLGGTGNQVFGGDENFTISGSTGSSTVSVGDGSNNITMGGTGNTVTVWGGDNMINAGGDNAVVKILGQDGLNSATPPDPNGSDPDFPQVPTSPTDNVIIAGTNDSVTATYENVNVLGTGVTSDATISLGNGNNMIILGGTGGNSVTVGNGANTINASGSNSSYTLGDGANGVTLTGNGDSNTITVNDTKGVGHDIVQLGGDTNTNVSLGMAGGSVTGTATSGTTTVTQTGPDAVTVNLSNGTGDVSLGNGADTVTANGIGSVISAGNGKDTVTANGWFDKITLGNGADKVTANGWFDTITLGNGNDTVAAGGFGDAITLGNGNDTVTANGGGDTFTFGNGNDTLTANGGGNAGVFGAPGLGGNNTLIATGSGDTWTFNEKASSTVNATIGANDSLTQTGGTLNVTGLGSGDTVNVTNTTNASNETLNGNNEILDFTNAGGHIALNPAATGDALTVNGVGSPGKYAGTLVVSGFGTSDTMDLEDLYGAKNPAAHITSFGQLVADLTFTPTGDVLNLVGGGEIKFAANTVLSASEFKFS